MSDYYDTAQICLNGHMINDSYRSYPAHNKKFCDKCGKATITRCPSCGTDIKGDYHMDDVIGGPTTPVPMNCHNCGKAYPWKLKLSSKQFIKKPKWLAPFGKWVGENLVKITAAVIVAVISTFVLLKLGLSK